MVRYDKTTAIYWNDAILGDPELDYDGASLHENDRIWCELLAYWSPQGQYLCTIHQQGVLLWGGKSYKELCRFPHENVSQILFSPNEHYLLTWNGMKDNRNICIILWDVYKGTKIKSYVYHNVDDAWPLYKFSFDSRYMATKGQNCIAVYELETMTLLGGKSIPLMGVSLFEWSPTKNVIAYWLPEYKHKPDQICIISIPTKEIIQNASINNVFSVEFNWHPQGYYLSVLLTRTTKNKKQKYSTIQLMDFKKKGIPLDVIDFKSVVSKFDWEPKGKKFSVVMPTNSSGNINDILFYKMTNSYTEKVGIIHTLTRLEANRVFWNPKGKYFVLIGIGKDFDGKMEFYNSEDFSKMNEQIHYQANDVQWDPSGRILASAVKATLSPTSEDGIRKSIQSGYMIWTLHGSAVFSAKLNLFYQFSWRPRPKSFITEEKQEEIIKNLNSYIEKYKIEDKRCINEKNNQEAKEKLEKIIEFRVNISD